jgi:hypothetical protein
MFDNYMGMRRRAVPAISEHGSLVDSLRASLIGLAEEIEQAMDAALSDVPTLVETVPAPAGDNVVALRPSPTGDKPPASSPPAAAAPAAPAFVNGLADIPESVRDTRPQNEPWRAFYGDNSRWEV